ncbi:MAG: transcription antitermination factor NusB [Clostridia bacterium]|nr:transcription antitermination factor NusB [Clostridia bacterium]
MGRKKARDNAFKCVYQFDFQGSENLSEILDFCYEENENDEEEKEYIIRIVEGVKQNLEKIDEIILSKLKNWNMSRISKVDLGILRLATYELLYTDIPVKVAVNEAVELAKEYGNDDSYTFVNGVLAKVIESKG